VVGGSCAMLVEQVSSGDRIRTRSRYCHCATCSISVDASVLRDRDCRIACAWQAFAQGLARCNHVQTTVLTVTPPSAAARAACSR
jgi:hypothetical protein